ncbi:hypothetical protein [Novosphingobium sp.]|uniref:hypothetical protein n=1 Tax=Novosphingobium sp. TaxID=1874826 RepID=UPI0025DEA3A3|nr:hypothetical protein [Novosphingobium sp.]MCC6925174.1 hypothetical protein [Novosphingobium sp.]
MGRRSVLASLLAAMFAGRSRADTGTVGDQAQVPKGPEIVTIDDPRYKAFAKARRTYWSKLGPVDDDVLTYLVSPEFEGAPAWPTTRQSFCVVRPESGLILASDGLSDLFVDTDMSDAGFGCEVYIETDLPTGSDFQSIRSSWQFSLIENFARNVANMGGIEHQLESYRILSMELPAPSGCPEDWLNDNEMIGVLINLSVPDRNGYCQLDDTHRIRMVPITILRPDELALVVSGGADAREKLASLLVAKGVGLRSPSSRKSVASN